jgi:hypothetical protein
MYDSKSQQTFIYRNYQSWLRLVGDKLEYSYFIGPKTKLQINPLSDLEL